MIGCIMHIEFICIIISIDWLGDDRFSRQDVTKPVAERLVMTRISCLKPCEMPVCQIPYTVDSRYKRTFGGHPKGCLYQIVASIGRI